jgi:hypothetical protein
MKTVTYPVFQLPREGAFLFDQRLGANNGLSQFCQSGYRHHCLRERAGEARSSADIVFLPTMKACPGAELSSAIEMASPPTRLEGIAADAERVGPIRLGSAYFADWNVQAPGAKRNRRPDDGLRRGVMESKRAECRQRLLRLQQSCDRRLPGFSSLFANNFVSTQTYSLHQTPDHGRLSTRRQTVSSSYGELQGGTPFTLKRLPQTRHGYRLTEMMWGLCHAKCADRGR